MLKGPVHARKVLFVMEESYRKLKESAKEPLTVAQGAKHGREKNAARRLATRMKGIGGSVRRPSRQVLTRLKEWDPQCRGQVATIDMESEVIFLGKDVVEATLREIAPMSYLQTYFF